MTAATPSSNAASAAGRTTHAVPGTLGTPGTATATRVVLLGSGELGKEVALELVRLGVEVVAVDRYAGAPAMAVATRSHVVDMLDGEALAAVLTAEQPDVVVPEIEAIATTVLAQVEATGVRVVPTARATRLTMDREGIRRLAAEELGLPTAEHKAPVMGRSNEGKPGTRKLRYGKSQKFGGGGGRRGR